TVVKTLTPKQDILAIAAIFAFAFIAGSLIRMSPGAADSYVDALSSGFGIANGVLLLARYREQWYAWIITLIMDATLYIRGGAYIMLVTVAAMMVNTCYGYWKWYRYNKEHANAQ
ncbi:MAG: nicotinamide mononucleotide transporter, partial [Firmicutes bacterium]|nr:nicotinamide mononucleotide transporter [Bacillota bacterium]